MDYCDLVDILGSTGTGQNPTPRPSPAPYDDTVIGWCITQASRAIDRLVTGGEVGSDDYFATATIANEVLTGQVTKNGNIVTFAHKPTVSAVSAFTWRAGNDDYQAVSLLDITIRKYKITAWLGTPMPRDPVDVKVSYTGGIASALATVPADVRRATIILAARFYKEARTGLSDVMGIGQELGTLTYTKAIPAEVQLILSPYMRPTPW